MLMTQNGVDVPRVFIDEVSVGYEQEHVSVKG